MRRYAMIVPCFNESARWSAEYWADLVTSTDADWLFVDDGSTDTTRALVERTCAETGASSLHLARNVGKAEAVRHGFRHVLESDGLAAVGFMDGDGAFDRRDVQKLLDASELLLKDDWDAVWAARVALAGRHINRKLSRHYLGRVIATYLSVGQPTFPYDTQCGLKLFAASDRLRSTLADPFETRWLFELEIVLRWRAAGEGELRIWEEPLDFWRDVPGSKITGRELVRVIEELITIKRLQRAVGR